eukprot:TRINITY_DN46205_c0_g1_i1.p1 TRINITY_DN46205_c0_g1~~TRINITY_DN46205_c0_g1_i1.p1  ORF type:complete len:528 (-),score=79.52 TRINITY_DN46205_c0_g1_i1:26-1609(-)
MGKPAPLDPLQAVLVPEGTVKSAKSAAGKSIAPGPVVPKRTKKREDPPAVAAVRAGDYSKLQAFDAEEVRQAIDHNGCGCLHWAAGDGKLDMCRYLVNEVSISVHVLTWNSRTPLHYAARNGQLEVCQWLVEEAGAEPDALARDDVTPFQMSVWQNHFEVSRWLGSLPSVDPKQVNRFNCSAAHWLALAPKDRANISDALDSDAKAAGASLIPLAQWLRSQGVDFATPQEQGHNALHKAAWAGHAAFCTWLRDQCGLMDTQPDNAGNYAADLAEQAGHHAVADWLRAHCSGRRAESCAILGVPLDCDAATLRSAYLERVRVAHPDRALAPGKEDHDRDAIADFSTLHQAYRHLTVERGVGSQRNARHVLQLMLPPPADWQGSSPSINTCKSALDVEESVSPDSTDTQGEGDEARLKSFKARLLAVITDFGDKGFPASLLRRRYSQVWQGSTFPTPAEFGISRKSVGLVEFLRLIAGDAVRVETFTDGRQPLLFAIQASSDTPSLANRDEPNCEVDHSICTGGECKGT